MIGKKSTSKEVEDLRESLRLKEIFQESLVRQHKEEISKLKSDIAIEKNELKATHAIELKEKEFEIKHLADDRVKTAEEATQSALTKLAVSEKENEMLHKMIDERSDVIEIKDLVTNLIDKLPEVKINSLSVSSSTGKK